MDRRATHPITYLARTNHRLAGRLFGIRLSDRRFHMYMIGKTGTGKSTLLRTMLAQDLRNGTDAVVLRKWLTAGFIDSPMDRSVLFPTTEGTP